MDVRELVDISLAVCRLYELYLLDKADHSQLAAKMEELYEAASEYIDDFMDE